MKYLQYRNDFLHKKIDLDKSNLSNYYPNSRMVNELLENDITWGGSLLGRLINSTIRKIGIATSRLQIEPLLNDLKRELDYLVSCSLQGDLKTKVDLLKIKGFMEQIKDQCFRPSENKSQEEEILKVLLATKADDYDPKDPKKNSETKGIVQALIDTLINDFPDLEEMIGVNKKVLMDTVSDFNQELRKYYYFITVGEDPGGDTLDVDSAISRFQTNFGNVYQALTKKEKDTSFR